MNCYQLSCGHWRSEVPGYEIGGIMPCLKCNTLRALVIGMTTGALSATEGRTDP